MSPRYISADEVANIMKDKSRQDYVIIDVRDDDFAGGNIKGAINVPSYTFLDGVDELAKTTSDAKLVVFHCALSQMRGPKAARIYEETLENMNVRKDNPDIAILRDGFTQFQAKFKDDPELVENWDREVWASNWH